MGKQCRTPPNLVNEDEEPSNIINIDYFYDKDFRQSMYRLFEGLNKTQEDMRVELRKYQTYMTEMKNLLGEVKKAHWKASPSE